MPFISRIQKQNEDVVVVDDDDVVGVDAGNDDVKNMNEGGGDGVLKEVGRRMVVGKMLKQMMVMIVPPAPLHWML